MDKHDIYSMIIQIIYPIADCRHLYNDASGMLLNWYNAGNRPRNCFLRNTGTYYSGYFGYSNGGCYYNAHRAIKINGWLRFKNEQKEKRGIIININKRFLYLNGRYATAAYLIDFEISIIGLNLHLLSLIDELFKLTIRVSKSFESQGNQTKYKVYAKDFVPNEYITTLGNANRQLINHYISVTTKKDLLISKEPDIYRRVKCVAPYFFVFLNREEELFKTIGDLELGLKSKESATLLKSMEFGYQGYVLAYSNRVDIKNYSAFLEAIALKKTLDLVLDEINAGHLLPSPRSLDSDKLQGFLKNAIDHFRKEENYVSDSQLHDMIYADHIVADLKKTLKRIKEEINIRPNIFKHVETYLNDIDSMEKKHATVIHNNQGITIVDSSIGGDVHLKNISALKEEQDLKEVFRAISGFLMELKESEDKKTLELKTELEEMKIALNEGRRDKVSERYEKIKTYGDLALHFISAVGPIITPWI